MDSSWRDSIALRAKTAESVIESRCYSDITARTLCCCRGPNDGVVFVSTSLGQKRKSQLNTVSISREGGKRKSASTSLNDTPSTMCASKSGIVCVGSTISNSVTAMSFNTDSSTFGKPTELTLPSHDTHKGADTPKRRIALDINDDNVLCVASGMSTLFVDATTMEIVMNVESKLPTTPPLGTTSTPCLSKCMWWGEDRACSASLCSDGTIFFMDPRTPRPPPPIQAPKYVKCLGSSSLVPYMFCAAGDGGFLLYDARAMIKPVVTTPTLQSGVFDICLSHIRANMVTTAATDGTVKLWEYERRVPNLILTPHETYPISLTTSTSLAYEEIVTCGSLGEVIVSRLGPEFYAPLTQYSFDEALPHCREVETAMYCRNTQLAHEFLSEAVSEARVASRAEDGLRLLALCTKQLNPSETNLLVMDLPDVLKELTYYVPTTTPLLEDIPSVDEHVKETVERLKMNMLLSLYVQNRNFAAVKDSMETICTTIRTSGEEVDTTVVVDCIAFLMQYDHSYGVTCAENVIIAIFEGDLGPNTATLLHSVVTTALQPMLIDEYSDSSSPALRVLYAEPSALISALQLTRNVVLSASSKRDAANAIVNTIAEYEKGVENEGLVSVLGIPSLPLAMLYINSLLQLKDVASFLWICSAYIDRYGSNKSAAILNDTMQKRLNNLQTGVTEMTDMVKQLCTKQTNVMTSAVVDDVLKLLGKLHALQLVYFRCVRCLKLQQRSINAAMESLDHTIAQLQSHTDDLTASWGNLMDRIRTNATAVKRAAPVLSSHKADLNQLLQQIPGVEEEDNEKEQLIIETCIEIVSLAK